MERGKSQDRERAAIEIMVLRERAKVIKIIPSLRSIEIRPLVKEERVAMDLAGERVEMTLVLAVRVERKTEKRAEIEIDVEALRGVEGDLEQVRVQKCADVTLVVVTETVVIEAVPLLLDEEGEAELQTDTAVDDDTQAVRPVEKRTEGGRVGDVVAVERKVGDLEEVLLVIAKRTGNVEMKERVLLSVKKSPRLSHLLLLHHSYRLCRLP